MSQSIMNSAPGPRTLRQLRQWIEQGDLPAGERLPAEQVLCERLGVARTTLRSALKKLETEGLVVSAGRARFVAQSLPDARSTMNNTVVILGEPYDADFDRDPGLGKGGLTKYIYFSAMQAAHDVGYHSLSLNYDAMNEPALRRLVSEHPLGVVAFRHTSRIRAVASDLLKMLKKQHIPVVVYGYDDQTADVDTVSHDHAEGEYMLTRWLIERGCKRILRCWGDAGTDNRHPWLADRDRGYEKALAEAGLPALRHMGPVLKTYMTSQQDYQTLTRLFTGFLADRLLGPEPVDALLAISDGDVYMLSEACRILGKIPQKDIAIVGYDNNFMVSPNRPFARATDTPLATIDKGNAAAGRKMVEILHGRANGTITGPAVHQTIPPQLLTLSPAIV